MYPLWQRPLATHNMSSTLLYHVSLLSLQKLVFAFLANSLRKIQNNLHGLPGLTFWMYAEIAVILRGENDDFFGKGGNPIRKVLLQKVQHSFPKRGQGGSEASWSFSENSSKSARSIIPKDKKHSWKGLGPTLQATGLFKEQYLSERWCRSTVLLLRCQDMYYLLFLDKKFAIFNHECQIFPRVWPNVLLFHWPCGQWRQLGQGVCPFFLWGSSL